MLKPPSLTPLKRLYSAARDGRWPVGGVRVTEDLLEQARSGDGEAFGRVVEPYRHELLVHCYRYIRSGLAAYRVQAKGLGLDRAVTAAF